MTMRNTLAQFAGVGALVVMGRVTYASGVPSLTSLSGNAYLEADVSVADTAAGVATITINPFLGPQGVAVAFGTSNTISTMVGATALTYTGDSLAVEFSIEDDASAATDANFYFQIWAY